MGTRRRGVAARRSGQDGLIVVVLVVEELGAARREVAAELVLARHEHFVLVSFGRGGGQARGGFDLERALSIRPTFLVPEYPFEWGGVYELPAGVTDLVIQPGPDASIDIALVPVADGSDAGSVRVRNGSNPGSLGVRGQVSSSNALVRSSTTCRSRLVIRLLAT